MAVRIKGLVQAFNDVRVQLQAGIHPDRAEDLRRHVDAVAARVEQICAERGTTPDSLPSPSRRAYRFLKELDTRDLPPPRIMSQTGAPLRVRVANVVKNGDLVSGTMWSDLTKLLGSRVARDQVASDMKHLVSRIEGICSNHQSTPSSLGAPSRRVYCWVRFLLADDNLFRHLAALERGRAAIMRLNPRPARVDIRMVNMSSLWRASAHGDGVTLRVCEGMLHADDRVWRALMDSSTNRRDGEGGRLIDEYVDSEDFTSILFEMEAYAEPLASSAAGHVHSLDRSFDRVNSAYFGGNLPKPRLVWNRVLTGRKFGHYQPSWDTVMLSVSLDDPAVPALLVDFVMYHELLHKQHGVKLVKGRRMSHTPPFRKDEQRFAAYKKATAQLDALARRHH